MTEMFVMLISGCCMAGSATAWEEGPDYGYYRQVIPAEADLNDFVAVMENDADARRIDSDIPLEDSLVKSSREIDRMLTEELETGYYSFEEPLVVTDPFQMSPLTAIALFTTEEEVSVRCTVKGKNEAADITGTTVSGTQHRVPVIGLYPGEVNTVLLELLDGGGNVTGSREVEVEAEGLPDSLTGMVKTFETCGESAYELTMVYGQGCTKPFAYDCNGDIRWYLQRSCANYGCYHLSNGNFILQDTGAYTPSQGKPQSTNLYELDYLGRAYRLYYLPHGSHHEVIEKEPGGNLLCLTSSFEDHFEDEIVEIDRETGQIVSSLKLEEIFGDTHVDMTDWAHINTVSWQEDHDTILISCRNLHSVIKIGWTSHELVWILADPCFWEGTPFEGYLLTTDDEEVLWHYQQHTSYQLEDDLDGDPDTVEISIYDNHTQGYRKIDTFTNTLKSYLTIYSVNEQEKTFKIITQIPVQRANICSITTYDSESGHLFGMCATVNKKKTGGCRGLMLEYDYVTGELLNRYGTRKKYYRATEAVMSFEKMSEPLPDQEYDIIGSLPGPVKADASLQLPQPEGVIPADRVSLKRTGNVLLVKTLDHRISQLIFKGTEHVYVYDTTGIRLKFEKYLQYEENMPVALQELESGTYEIWCVYEDVLYRIGEEGTNILHVS